jgi:hypothetical protein
MMLSLALTGQGRRPVWFTFRVLASRGPALTGLEEP